MAETIVPGFEGLGYRFPVRVYYEDTDAAGIVYHTSYLRFAERARTEMVRALGFGHGRTWNEMGMATVVRRCAIDFLAPARLDDLLEVWSQITSIGGASAAMRQAVRLAGGDVARLQVKLACVSVEGRPRPWPRELRDALEALAESDATDQQRRVQR
jgi:acyl-CoA thioester hydrolase